VRLDTVDPERMAALARLGPAEAADAVEEVLRASVRRRLMADVPVGTMCSGGVDSSLLTKFAAEESPQIHAFNAAIVDQPEFDESEFARRAADAAGVRLHTVEVTAATWRRDFVDIVAHVEYPLTHPSSVPMGQIARMARDNGVKVLLSGEGADELFGGYPWVHGRLYRDFTMRRSLWQRPLRSLRADLERVGLGRPERWPPLGPLDDTNAFEDDVIRQARDAYAHHSGPRGRLEGGLGTLPALYLPHLLNRQDKTTMWASVETRVPFLDPDVVALALNLPLESKLEPSRKELLHELVRRHVPVIAGRQKVGFGMDAARFIEPAARPEFLSDGVLRDIFESAESSWGQRLAALDPVRRALYWSGEVWARTMLLGEPVARVREQLWREDPDTASAPVGQLSHGASGHARI
jgi:asparagine synthase (glutamine-hydrolysing)